MEAGGQKGGSSITVDCPSVVGATPQQQASTCALFKTGAETGIQTRLFNQGGGKRRNKTRNRYAMKKRTRSILSGAVVSGLSGAVVSGLSGDEIHEKCGFIDAGNFAGA